MGNSQDCFSCFETPNIIVALKTGDTRGSSLHNCAYLTLIDANGKESKEYCLSGCCVSVFKRGHTDVFTFSTELKIGPIKKIRLARSELHDRKCVDWFVEKVEIRRYFESGEREDLVFPVHRWIRNRRPITITMHDTLLQQDDDEPEQRETELFWKRTMYRYHRRAPCIPPQISVFPKDEVFSGNYKWDVVVRKQTLKSKYKLPTYGNKPWENLYEFDDIYGKKISTPAGRHLWRDDRHFGMQRLMGCCPILISLCKEIPVNFAVTSEMVLPFLEGLELDKALEDNRIFIVNLHEISKIQLDNNRKVCSPFALFFLNNNKELMPIAIQLFQEKSANNPVFLPGDPWYTWSLAKMWFNHAEAQYHRACALIGFTHLVIESIAIATHRQLSPSHPIFRLLAPFIRDIIAINSFEVNELLAPGSWLDSSTSLGSKGIVDLLQVSFQDWRLDLHGCLPKDLERRGVADQNILPVYPYRDDALLLYQAVESYVTAVVTQHYTSQDILTSDSELAEWAKDLAQEGNDGCGIKGIPGDGTLSSITDLITLLTCIIFTSTVSNSATNTPQYEEYGFLPNYPSLLLGDPPRDKAWREESDILQCLPPKQTCLDIMLVTKLLAERRRYGFSNMRLRYQSIPEEVKAFERFLDELKGISHSIQDHNRKRGIVYDYLNPFQQSD